MLENNANAQNLVFLRQKHIFELFYSLFYLTKYFHSIKYFFHRIHIFHFEDVVLNNLMNFILEHFVFFGFLIYCLMRKL